MECDYGAYEGRSTVDIEADRPGWRPLRDGSPGGETPIKGRRLLLDTASVSVLGYDHDISEPVIHARNGRGT